MTREPEDPKAAPPTVFRRLLRLYPRGHRERYGEEMLSVAEHRWRRAGGGSKATTREAAGLIRGAAGVWNDRMRRTTMKTGRGWMTGWLLDGRFLARSLWRSRGYVATTVLVLACAVAATASVFSYVRGTLLAESPYQDPESLMVVWGSNVQNGQLRDVISGPNFIDLQERITALDPVAAFHTDAAYLMVDGRPEVLDANEVSADFFRALGVEAELGRLFDDRERMSGGARTVVVTYGFWRDRLEADPGAVGSVLSLEGDPRTVIGVLPEDFDFVSPTPLSRCTTTSSPACRGATSTTTCSGGSRPARR